MPSDSQMCLGLFCNMVSELVKQWGAEVQKQVQRLDNDHFLYFYLVLTSNWLLKGCTVNSLP